MPLDFAVVLNSGQRITFDSLLGKVVAVELLLTTCQHCQRCGRTMQKLYDEFAPQGFSVLGAAIDDGARNNLLSFLVKTGARFPVGAAVDRAAAYRLVEAETTQLIYFPQLVFVDRKGIIRSHFGGTDDFFKDEEANARTQIETLLKGDSK